ncbi:hypothetical protein OE749_01645 [Aestuariibacter sp. AA17]|uniref:Uncharacterized protein n=1 Tax=Fluctibacter corallii TaxID=2984329 RepID=A0ABT3A447_9ALTE|nr:hypothetical protein [Aestuariibacter sp. AA17]MCV2883400.1 hypothetical protein [Aestuariibacter sp. AA17]
MRYVFGYIVCWMLIGCSSKPDTEFITQYETIQGNAESVTATYMDLLSETDHLARIFDCRADNVTCVDAPSSSSSSNDSTINVPTLPSQSDIDAVAQRGNEAVLDQEIIKHGDEESKPQQSRIVRAREALSSLVTAFDTDSRIVLTIPSPFTVQYADIANAYYLQRASLAMSAYYKALEAIANADGKKQTEEAMAPALDAAKKLDKVVSFFGGPRFFEAAMTVFASSIAAVNDEKVNAEKRKKLIALMEQYRWLPRLMAGEAACRKRNEARLSLDQPQLSNAHIEHCEIDALRRQCAESSLPLTSGTQAQSQWVSDCQSIKYYSTFANHALITAVPATDDITGRIQRTLRDAQSITLLERDLLVTKHDGLINATIDFVLLLEGLQLTMSEAAYTNEMAYQTLKENDKISLSTTFKTLSRVYKALGDNLDTFSRSMTSAD